MAETKSGSTSVQFHGLKGISNGVNRRSEAEQYLCANEGAKPNMSTTVNWSITRDNSSSGTVHVNFSGKLWRLCKYTRGTSYPNSFDSRTGNYGNSRYGYELNLYLQISYIASDGSVKYEEKHVYHKPNQPYADGYWTSDKDFTSQSFDINWPKNSKMTIKLRVRGGCKDYEGCSAGDYTYTIAEVTPPSYSTWSAPTQAVVNTNLSSPIKPDGSLKVSWSAAKAGTGNTIKYYSVNGQRYRDNKWSDRVSLTGSTVAADKTSITITPRSYLSIRPGDLIRIDVNTYVDNVKSDGTDGWTEEIYGFNYSNEIEITAGTSCIYYKDSTGAKKNVTMAYMKDSNNKRKARYILVKEANGTQKVIDVYTTLYE